PAEITEYARTMAFMTIIACQLFYSLSFRNHVKSIFQVGITSNFYLIGAIVLGFALQLFVLGVPFMRNAFKLQALGVDGWIKVLALGLIPLALNEIAKIIIRLTRSTQKNQKGEGK